MDPLTVTTATFMLTGPGLTPVLGTVTYVGLIATFTPTSNLTPNTLYTATITTGARDLAGNALAANYTWTFTTGAVPDTTNPTVTFTDPANGATGVAINKKISATFSEGMDPLTVTNLTFTVAGVSGTVAYNAITKTATFTPTTPAMLANNTTYTATITTGARDLAGNALANNYVWSFTTGAAAPLISPGILDPFAIASAGGITNSGATKINGDVVLNPTATCNLVPVLFADGPGFGLCGGDPLNVPTNNVGDVVITPIYPDAITAPPVTAALNAKWISISPAIMPGATVLGCGVIGSTGGAGAGIGCSGNSTLPPGVYISATGSSIGVSGTLTLNGAATDVWVFQAPSSTVITAVNSTILLTGGAKASNVWWYVGSSATLNGGTTFQGNILASASISMGTGATSCGRLLAGATGAGAFTFLANTVSVPGHPNAPAGCE
jgi:hypothetical protein